MPGLMPVNQEPIVIVVATPSLSLDALQIEIKLYLQNFSAYTVLMSGNVSLDLVLEMLDCNTVLLWFQGKMQSSHMSLSMSSYCNFSLHGIRENAEFVQLVQILWFKKPQLMGKLWFSKYIFKNS